MTAKSKFKNYKSIFVPLNNILLTLCFIIFIAFCVNIFMYTESIKLFIDKQLEAIVLKAALTINKNINEKIVVLQMAADISNLSNAEGKRKEMVLYKLYGKDLAFRELIVFDTNGIVISRVSRQSKYFSDETLKNIADDVLAGYKEDTTYISNVFIDKKTFEPVVIISVPIRDIFGDFKGSLLAVTNLKFMWDIVADLKIGKTGQAYVVDKKGNLIACKDISRVLKGGNVKYLSEVNEFISSNDYLDKSRSRIKKGIDGKIVVTSHVSLGVPDWGIVFELPVKEAYMPVLWIIIGSLITVAIGVVISIISIVKVSKMLIKPLSELRDAANEIGQGNLNIKVKIHSENEFGEVAESFNAMVEKLCNSTTSIDNLKKEIAERKAAEEKLIESEEKFRTLSLELPIGVMLINQDGVILFSNEQWEKIFEYNGIVEKWDGWEKIVDDVFLEDIKVAWDNLLRKRENFNMEFSIRNNTKELLWLNVKALFLISDDGSKIIVLAENITDRKNAEIEREQTRIQLIHSEKLAGLGQLAAGIAHEINNPVGFVLGNSETMADYFKSIKKMCDLYKTKIKDDEIEKARDELDLDYIVNDLECIIDDNLIGLKRIVAIVTNLKNFARIERGNEIVEADLEENIECTVNIAKNEIKYHADVKTEFGNISPVWCNIGEINQVFLNILVNAAQAIQQQQRQTRGLITVRTWETDDNKICISVADDGPGIEDTNINKIFDPFFTTKPIGKGTGLGLNIAWDIVVNRHNGEINVESKIGSGTIFTVILPKKLEKQKSISL